MNRLLSTLGCLVALGASAQSRTLSLDEAIALAIKNQPTLKQADALVDAAEGRRVQQRAPLLPQITGSMSYQRVHRESGGGAAFGSGGAVITGSGPNFNLFSGGLSASQVLWDFAAIQRFRAAGFTVDAQRASERASRLQLELQVRTAYFNARAQRALHDVAQQTLDNELKHQAQIEGFVRAGIRPEIDLAQSKTAVANARVQVVNARNNYLIAKAQLRQAMGGANFDFDIGTEDMPTVEGENAQLDELTAQALKNRPELASIFSQHDASVASLRAAQGGFMPTLSATAALNANGTALSSLQPFWQGGFVLSWQLFQGGLTVGQMQEQRANIANVDASLEVQRLQISLEVEQAQLLLLGGLSSLDAAGQAEESARTQLQLAEARYTQGVGSIIEQGDAQVAFTTAAAQKVQAQLNLFAARAQLIAALGQST